MNKGTYLNYDLFLKCHLNNIKAYLVSYLVEVVA